MSNKTPHQKHAKLTRPALGRFARFEWAIIGTPCGAIQQLARTICGQMGKQYKMAYVDADHQTADAEEETGRPASSVLAHQGTFEYTDKITYHRIDFEAQLDTYQFRNLFNDQDLVLVNGNHFKAARQIVVVDPRKEKSLKKKLDRLTEVELFLLADGVEEVPAYLKEACPAWDRSPVLQVNDEAGIADFLQKRMKTLCPPISALILAGGKSQRMGTDKGLLNYHGQPQRAYMMELVSDFCQDTYLSARPGQITDASFPIIEDSFQGLGPMGAILSAFRQQPNHAWLVLAVDLPLLDRATLEQLLQSRNPSKLATAFNSPHNEFPEPLITIWEPRAYPVLLQFLAQGYSCPRKVLINSEVELITAANPAALTNVNHPDEFAMIKEQLKNK